MGWQNPGQKRGTTSMSKPELAALRHSLKPAFLWDPVRRRIVWANAAAMQWFGARSLSELVERPFDAREAGVRTLTQLAQTAVDDGETHVSLAFPSTGQEAPLSAVVRPHDLPSGGAGLLVTAEQASSGQAPVLAEILNEMPQPVLALTPVGEPVYVNAAARELLGPQAALDIQQLFPSPLALRTFLLRALEAGTAVETRTVATRVGERLLRLTARASQQGDLVVMTIDDLTDRLQAERLEMMPSAFSSATQSAAMEPRDEDGVAPPHADTTNHSPATRLAPEELTALRRLMEAVEAETEQGPSQPAIDPLDTPGDDVPQVATDTAETDTAEETDTTDTGATSATERPTPQTAPAEAPTAAEPMPRARARISIRRRPSAMMERTVREPAEEAAAPAAMHAGEETPRAHAHDRTTDETATDEKIAAERAGNEKTTPCAPKVPEGPHAASSAPAQPATDTDTTASTHPSTAADEDASAPLMHLAVPMTSETPNETPPHNDGNPAAQKNAPKAPSASVSETAAAESAHKATEAAVQKSQQAETSPATDESGHDAQALASLAHGTVAETGSEEAATDQAATEEDEEERERPEPPALVREVLDHRPEPIILHRSESFYYANKAAMECFGFPLQDKAWDELAQRLSATQEGEEIVLQDAQGRDRLFRLKRDVFPWRAGVVVQSTLEPLKTRPDRSTTTSGDRNPGAHAAAALRHGELAKGTERTKPAPEPALRQAEKRTPAPVIRIQTERLGGGRVVTGHKTNTAPKPLLASEVPWNTIRENAVDGLLLLDEAGTILELDGGAQRLLQVAEAEARGKPLRAFLQRESASALDSWLANQNKAVGANTSCREMWLKTAQGQCVPVRLLLGRVRGLEAHNAVYCAALCDISEWKKREEELIRAREKAEAESARKSAFLASISHELRTPLNAILGFAEVLQQELYGPLGNEKYRDYARDIHESGKHLLALVNDLLDMARVESGRLHVEFTEVNLAEVVTAAVKLLRDKIAASGIELVRITPDNLPKVVADKRSMKQILLNLLSNAIAYGRKGGKVVIALKQRENGAVELAVKDNGPGMTKEELEAALQPYRRVPRTGGEETRGTGLGLPLAKALTQANKATFEIESTPEKGTEVRIIFPPHRVLS